MAKIKVRQTETAEETFARFLLIKRAEGISKKTAESYSQHFHAISKHRDVHHDIQAITNRELEMMIVSM